MGDCDHDMDVERMGHCDVETKNQQEPVWRYMGEVDVRRSRVFPFQFSVYNRTVPGIAGAPLAYNNALHRLVSLPTQSLSVGCLMCPLLFSWFVQLQP